MKPFFVTDFHFMFMTNLFRFLVLAFALTFLYSSVLRAESESPAGPPAPVFSPIEESSEIPDVSGVEDSIQIDDLNEPGPAEAPAVESPEKESVPLESPTVESQEPEIPDSLDLETKPSQETNAVPTDPSLEESLQSADPKEKPLETAVEPKEKKEIKRLASTDETKPGKKNDEEISVSRRLLFKVSPPDSILDGVEQVDLRTFLNAPTLRDDEARTREALPYYWKAAELRSEVFYWANRLEAMNSLAESASGSEREVYKSAAAAAKASLSLAKVTLRSNAMKLASLAGYTREVTAKTLPHAGEYNTRYDEIVDKTSRITYYHGLITFHQEQLTAAASAYMTAESLLNLVRQKGPASAVLASWDVLNERRKVFFEVLLSFNDDILNYVLTISTRRGPELAPLLVKPDSTPSSEGASTLPSLPTPPAKAPDPPAALPSVLAPGQTAASSQADTPIRTQDPETGQVYSENDSIDVQSAATAPEVSSEPVPAGGNEPVQVVPEAPVPGYDLGAPPVETAPSGSDFIPIGGETGVNTNPVLRETRKPSIGENGFSLVSVLERASYSEREKAVHAYWRYVELQDQSFVLEHQKNLLSFISRRLLDSLLGKSEAAPLPSELGTILELQALILRVELLEIKAEEWKVLDRLANHLSWKVQWPLIFPVAMTDLKTKGFTLGLDQNVSGSEMDRRALPWARQLYFAREELSDSFACVTALEDLIAPSDTGLEESKLGGRLKNGSAEELVAVIESMAEARNVSWKYFQLLYDVNAAYTSCVLAGVQGGKEPGELAALLAN